MKAKVPGGSPGGIYGGTFFLTGSWRENTRAGKIPAGSRRGSGFLAGSRQDPGGFFTRVTQLVYLLTPLKSNYSALTEINKLLYTFLRNGKGVKIKRNVIINDFCDGGLKMIDIFSFNKSLKATWIKKYLDNSNNGKWKLFLEMALQNHGGKNILSSKPRRWRHIGFGQSLP